MADRELSVDIERRHRQGPTVRAAFAVDLADGEVLAIFGPSGAGKSTVLRCVAGLERPQAGRISAAGRTWFDAAEGRWLPPQRRRIGHVPQRDTLFPHLSVRANVAYGVRGVSREEEARRVRAILGWLDLASLEGRRPAELSGGQRHRAALGRALACQPLVLLLDEPLSGLDELTRAEVRRSLGLVIRRSGTAALLVSHDATDVLALADRVVVLVDGAIRQVGRAEDVFLRPADDVVARLVGADVLGYGRVVASSAGLIDVSLAGQRLVAVGDLPVGTRVLVSVRPEEVALLSATGVPRGLSTRNLLRGRVTGMEPRGALVLVTLEAGLALRALVTRLAAAELGLAPGASVTAAVKAPSIHVAEAPARAPA